MASRRAFGIGQLGRRLALAFVAVAIAAILITAVVSELSVHTDTTTVARQQEQSLARAVALTSGAAYQGIGWARANLAPVFDIARRAGAAVSVRDASNRLVGVSSGYRTYPASSELRQQVTARGHRVGSVIVRFGPAGLGALANNLNAELWRARLEAAAIAAVLALLVSFVVARQISLPLDRMLETARARGAGDRSARVSPLSGVGVLRELLEVFNESTDVVDQQDRLRRNLFADIAHELRTPVAILQAGHEAMLDGISEPTAENLASLRDEVLRLARMVDDLQALASAEAAALQMVLVPQDLAEIAADAAASLGDSYEMKGVSLVRQLTSATLACDKRRIHEVVTNLLTNALKFTPSGGNVVLRAGHDDAGAVMLRVSDTGVGIPADELPLVTERFFRGQRSRETAAGSGIGLTIVSELVRAHHGQLEIASDAGAGTAVTVRFPDAAGSGRLHRHAG